MDWLVKTLEDNFHVIVDAPIAAILLMLLSAWVAWLFRGHLANAKADAQNERIEFLKDQLGVSSEQDLPEAIRKLKTEIEDIKENKQNKIILANATI